MLIDLMKHYLKDGFSNWGFAPNPTLAVRQGLHALRLCNPASKGESLKLGGQGQGPSGALRAAWTAQFQAGAIGYLCDNRYIIEDCFEMVIEPNHMVFLKYTDGVNFLAALHAAFISLCGLGDLILVSCGKYTTLNFNKVLPMSPV